MSRYVLPDFLARCVRPQAEALKALVRSGTSLASGFATSEPSAFYRALWEHIQREDLTDVRIRQALFMGPYPLCVGDALSARGKLAALRKLIAHFEELKRRRIQFVSGFVGPAENMVVPDNALLRLLYPAYAGRNRTRMGLTDMQSVHFSDAVSAMVYDNEGRPLYDLAVVVMTPPNEDGELSHGAANGVNGDIVQMAAERPEVRLLLYLSDKHPFTRGHGDAPNTIRVELLRRAADEGRLTIVEDDAEPPGLPRGAFDHPTREEEAIAEHVVNHIEAHRELTNGRAIQVGIGGTGVQAMKRLLQSSWTGRSYTEMLEPFTYELMEAGKIAGSHFMESDGRRTRLDGKMVCTFTMAEQGSCFYQKLHNNPRVIIAPGRQVVVTEAFYGGLGINNILGVDFQGHMNCGGRDKNHYSGVGGAATIVRGLANGGVSYFCLKSTHRTPEGKLRSSIFPFLPLGTPVSVIGPDVFGTRNGARFYLVTEHGIAQINAQTQGGVIKSLISVADPRFRDWLKAQAWKEFRVRV